MKNDLARLLALRLKAKKKKPHFVIKESHFVTRIKARWRYPRGRHSAARQEHRGRPALVTPGYGGPVAVRGLHSSGLRRVIVSTPKQLLIIKPAEEGIIIASSVGSKKRLQLLTLAQEKKITVLNFKDVPARVASLRQAVDERKKHRISVLQRKSTKDEERKRKAAEVKQKKQKNSEEGKNKKSDSSVSEEPATKTEEEKQREIIEKTLVKRH
ncbi:TPA: 50S ribosomal protein L32e [Candidatus Woesearchaeota archaeon]|nr:50S ribosomal protein L32e [Candidatus Woesearchaeota archaeon]